MSDHHPQEPGRPPASIDAEQSWEQLQRIKRHHELILQAAGEGVYGLDCEGLTTFVNPAAARMLGWQETELIGKPMHQLLHHSRPDGSHYPKLECPIHAAFKDGAVHQVDDEVFWRKDGSCFPVEYTSTPIYEDGKLAGAVVVFKDVSERKGAEEALRKAYAEVARMKERLEAENVYLQEEIRTEHQFKDIVGQSSAIQQVLKQIELVAPTLASVLICGESGTGKELIARAIHERSERSKRPLIRVNCAAIPRELFESEFFGHVKGAFTGALKDRAGRFELADGGTLFLDEVGEIPLEQQGKLLRVLQEGQFERVGEEHTRSVDVRVIAATNRELKLDVEAQRFREDLYFRLNVFPIEVMPLRQRRQDIPLLAQHFVHETCKRFNCPEPRLSKANVKQLQAYAWRGNIRELQNVVERAIILSNGGRLRFTLPQEVSEEGAEDDVQAASAPFTEAQRLARDKANLLAVLAMSDGKVAAAADYLGIKSTTLASRLKTMGIRARRRSEDE